MKKSKKTNKLVLYNDDIHSVHDVIFALVHTFGYNEIQAQQITMLVHTVGKYTLKEGKVIDIVGYYSELKDTGLNVKLEKSKQKRYNMESINYFSQMKELWEEFETNHLNYHEKGVKASAQRARKSIGEIKKLITEYRKASVEETKNK